MSAGAQPASPRAPGLATGKRQASRVTFSIDLESPIRKVNTASSGADSQLLEGSSSEAEPDPIKEQIRRNLEAKRKQKQQQQQQKQQKQQPANPQETQERQGKHDPPVTLEDGRRWQHEWKPQQQQEQEQLNQQDQLGHPSTQQDARQPLDALAQRQNGGVTSGESNSASDDESDLSDHDLLSISEDSDDDILNWRSTYAFSTQAGHNLKRTSRCCYPLLTLTNSTAPTIYDSCPCSCPGPGPDSPLHSNLDPAPHLLHSGLPASLQAKQT